MKYYDVTAVFSKDMARYPGSNAVKLTMYSKMDNGDVYNGTFLTGSLHMGTHIDTPKHMNNSGATTDTVDLNLYMGKSKLIEIYKEDKLELKDIEGKTFEQGDIVIFKTMKINNIEDASKKQSNPYITAELANFLVEKKVKSVGVDFISIDPLDTADFPAHVIFCDNGLGIIEGLVLDEVSEGYYDLMAVPMKIKGADGCPVRALLFERK